LEAIRGQRGRPHGARITWTICSRILIERGTVTEVDVRKEVAPLFVVAASSGSTPRSRPGSDPGHRTLVHGVLVGGLEGLLELIAAGAA
jgi:hypothetical protein